MVSEAVEATECEAFLASLLGIPKPPPGFLCPAAVGKCARSRKTAGRGLVFRPPCRCWFCPVCLRRLQYHRGLYYARHLLNTEGMIYGAWIPDADWVALMKLLWRKEASWVRVDRGDETFLMLSTKEFQESESYTVEDAIRLLGSAMKQLKAPDRTQHKRYRPVNSSTSWKLPSREPGDWEPVGNVRCRNPEAVGSLLSLHGIPYELIEAPGRYRRGQSPKWTVSLQFPEDWEQDRRDALLEAICDLK